MQCGMRCGMHAGMELLPQIDLIWSRATQTHDDLYLIQKHLIRQNAMCAFEYSVPPQRFRKKATSRSAKQALGQTRLFRPTDLIRQLPGLA